jgi:hypothetical protein
VSFYLFQSLLTNIYEGQERLTQVYILPTALRNVCVSMVLRRRYDGFQFNYDIHMYLWIPKVLTFTADNASNNDTLVDELSVQIPSFGGSDSRIRCFAHVLNLVVKVLSPTAGSPCISRILRVLELF